MLDSETSFACQLVTEAGQRILSDFQPGRPVSYKPDGEPVTDMDRAINTFLVTELQRRFPDDLIISEEAEDDDARRRALAHRVWFIDPIDGTREFIAGNGEFSVMIRSVCGRLSRHGSCPPAHNRQNLVCQPPRRLAHPVEVLSDIDNTAKQAAVRQKVRELTRDFPLYAQ
jgi:hypothetical protein